MICHAPLLLCLPDRSLVFCDVSMIDSAYKISCYHRVLPGVVYDMAVDGSTEIAVTVGQVNFELQCLLALFFLKEKIQIDND